MYGTLNVKRENGEGVTFHAVHSVELINNTYEFIDLDVVCFVPGDNRPVMETIELRLSGNERAYETNGLGETVESYRVGKKR